MDGRNNSRIKSGDGHDAAVNIAYAASAPSTPQPPMTAAAIEPTEGFLRWRYLAWSLAALAAMIAAIVAGNLWLLDFVHVASSLLWTGIDLFMGFVLGPILRRLPLAVRREIMRRLTPRTLFLMPTVSIVGGTSGWFLAVALGYTALPWPDYAWVAATLVW